MAKEHAHTGKDEYIEESGHTEEVRPAEAEETVQLWRADERLGPQKVAVPAEKAPGGDPQGRVSQSLGPLILDEHGESVWVNSHFKTKERALDCIMQRANAGIELMEREVRRLEEDIETIKAGIKENRKSLEVIEKQREKERQKKEEK